MQSIHHTLNTVLTDFFRFLQKTSALQKVQTEISAFAEIEMLLTPALAWQCLQTPSFVGALPQKVSEWLAVLDVLSRIANTDNIDKTNAPAQQALLMRLHTFWFHTFAWRLPELQQDVSFDLASLYERGDFTEPRVLVALLAARVKSQHPQNPPSAHHLNTLYATAARSFHAYRLHTPLHLAGWFHGLALALQSPWTERSKMLHPFLVNALKATWNDSEQQRFFVHTLFAAMPENDAYAQSVRQVYTPFIKGRKALDQVRRTEDKLYTQWQRNAPLKPLIEHALQDLLHQGQVGSISVFVRHDDSYTPLHISHTPYGYRQEAGQWCWRSHTHFSQHNPRDQRETLAQQQLQAALNDIYHSTSTSTASPTAGTGLRGTKKVQSRWWPAGEALFIASLHARSLVHDLNNVHDLQNSPDLLWCEDAVLVQTFMDGCERVACEQRAGLQVSTALRACAQQIYDGLLPQTLTATDLSEALMRLSLPWVEQALEPLAAEGSLPFYLCWARRQVGGVPVDGFCQPLMYESDGQQSVPAVLLWGAVHRPPQVGLLPFVSRLHMYEIAPLSNLMRYWASNALLQWRQDLSRLRVQQQRKDEEYRRIQQAFEKIRQCREQENLAWAALRNQIDPPELLAYGVASNYALQQSYTRLHRPEQITSSEALLCFLAELSTGVEHHDAAQAEDTLKQLQLRAPTTLVAELFHYWKQRPVEQHTLSTAQSLFNYCKIIVYDGSQVEPQLPGMLSLVQLVYTFHRMADYANTLGKRLQRQSVLSLQLHWQGTVFNSAQLHLHRVLRTSKLQHTLMGTALEALQDTRHISPCFALGQEQLALGFMEGLYALYTTHFSPALEGLNPSQPQRLWVKTLRFTNVESADMTSTGFQLRLRLSGSFSETARQKIAQTGPHSTHDLRRVLHHLRESLGVKTSVPWFFTAGAEPHLNPRGLYFCEKVGQDKHTELVVNLSL